MSTIITAPEIYTPMVDPQYKIFLAGAIDMGAAVDWQSYVIEKLQDIPRIVVFNPRRPVFSADTLDEQIQWELEALEMVNLVFMWLPINSKAPISFFEAGLYWKSGKLMIGAEQGFYRRRNLEITADRYAITVYDDLDEMIARVRLKATP